MYRYKIVLYNNTISNQNNVGYVLKTINSVKYLCIFIDENVKWNIHIDHINNIVRTFILFLVNSEIFCH